MGEILCLNAGSSSLKFALFDSARGNEPRPLLSGKIENIGLEPHLVVRDGKGAQIDERRWSASDNATHETLLAGLLDRVEKEAGRNLVGVGHRVVHGGTQFHNPARIDEALLARLDALCALAPLHQPHNLAAIRAVAAARPALPQVACFDTAFHHAMPVLATRLALPRSLGTEGMRRYGFHGISYEYIARKLQEIEPARSGGRVIAAHLGNGASLCAIHEGRSIDTTMGFTALDGLVMGTRCGALDPGAVLYLFQEKHMSVDQVEHLLYNESGLLGISDISSDMRALLESDDPRATEAIDLFSWQFGRQAGALLPALGGLDQLVFTGGIGENAAPVRARLCERLRWLDVEIDDASNARNDPVISTLASRVVVRVIPTDEERMIAIHTADLLTET